MQKFGVLLCLALVLLAVPLAAQEATPEPEIRTSWTCPEGFEGQTLNVYNWSLYIADDTVGNFETLCGVTVNYDVYVSNEDLLTRLREGNPGYDIAVPTGYMVEILIAEDLLEPINLENIPNFANVSETFVDPPYDPDNQYSVPYQWGTVGIAYRADMVDEAPTTWDDMFAFEGNVAWLEDVRAMVAVGLIKLGYDPNTSNVDEIAEARDYLMANGNNVSNIVMGNSQELLAGGSVAMAVDYPGNTFQLQFNCLAAGDTDCDKYQFVVPEEGTNLWMDNLVIPAGAPNKALAEVWMDYILDPQVSADISNFTYYGSPNQVAVDDGLLNPDLLENPAIFPPQEILDRSFVTASVTPEAEQAYLDAWDEIKVLLGQ